MSSTQGKAIAENWRVVLTELVQEAEYLAQTVEREGKLDVETLVQTLVLGCLENPDASLKDFIEVAHELGVDVVKSSLHERITPRLALLLTALVDLSVKRVVAPPPHLSARLKQLSGMYVVDSTQITVCQALYETFRGSAGVAKLKLHVAFNYLTGTIHMLDYVAGCQPDQKCGMWEALLQPEALYLFDLGYFNQDLLRDIQQADAYFVTRCQSQVALYDPQTLSKVDLSQQLKHHQGNVFEGVFCLGARVKLPVRVIARRVPPDVAAARRRHAKQKAKEQGQTCRAAYLLLLDWDILVTNLPTTWTPDDILLLYGIRWQIEMVFKVWKSQVGIAQLGAWRPARVMCQFYAHLLGAILCHQTLAVLRWHPRTLTSLAKGVSVIQHQLPHLHRVIRRHWYGLASWAKKLRSALLQFAQHDKRKIKPTTMQILMDWG